ncbi:hypothetical protein [Glycocaulis sp.]|nr:hypothetical protein [Glycocaulis sp.]
MAAIAIAARNDPDFGVNLFPANLDVENRSNIIEAGVRFYF